MTSGARPAGEAIDGLVAAIAGRLVRVVDLTHPLGDDTPVIELPSQFEPSARFELDERSRYDERGPLSYKNAYASGEHVGTHFDAPIHWITGRARASVDEIPMESLIAPALVIDKTRAAQNDPGVWLTVDDVCAFEAEHGTLTQGAWLLLRTGWSHRHGSQDEFLNASVWPGPDVECARYLAASGIVGFGTETVGIDHGAAASLDPPFPAHHYLLGAGKFGLASLANLDALPVTGALLIAAPLRISRGSGSSMRACAFVATRDAPPEERDPSATGLGETQTAGVPVERSLRNADLRHSATRHGSADGGSAERLRRRIAGCCAGRDRGRTTTQRLGDDVSRGGHRRDPHRACDPSRSRQPGPPRRCHPTDPRRDVGRR